MTRGYHGHHSARADARHGEGVRRSEHARRGDCHVVTDSPAAKAGLKVGDVITAVNGIPVEDVNSFRLQVAGFAPSTTVHLKVDRGGQTLDLPVTLGEFNLEAENKGDNEGNLPERRREGRSEGPVRPGFDA